MSIGCSRGCDLFGAIEGRSVGAQPARTLRPLATRPVHGGVIKVRGAAGTPEPAGKPIAK